MEKIKHYIADLELAIVDEDPAEELIIVDDEDHGIKSMIIDCEEPILILEQLIMEVPEKNQAEFYKRLLQMNATLVHGAFLIDDDAKYVFFRDTLEIDSMDKNELESSIRSLTLALAEHGDELIQFSRNE